MSWELCNFLKKHNPVTWGDALNLIRTMQEEQLEKFVGELGYSRFMTDLLWHISTIDGPLGKIEYT